MHSWTQMCVSTLALDAPLGPEATALTTARLRAVGAQATVLTPTTLHPAVTVLAAGCPLVGDCELSLLHLGGSEQGPQPCLFRPWGTTGEWWHVSHTRVQSARSLTSPWKWTERTRGCFHALTAREGSRKRPGSQGFQGRGLHQGPGQSGLGGWTGGAGSPAGRPPWHGGCGRVRV